jgi:uncharacterized protein (DUF1697 family)
MKHVALLRGINVGGKHALPMKALAAMFADAGCVDVATYIQSGNVVFSAPAAVAKAVPAKIAARIAKDFGFSSPVVVRSATELAAVVAGAPFRDPEHTHVMFLADAPTKAAVAALDPNRSPGDRFVVVGRDVYLHLPNGAGRTKLTNAYVDAKLGTTSTQRNWRTVEKLAALAGS